MSGNGSIMIGINVVRHEKDYPASPPIFKASLGKEVQRNRFMWFSDFHRVS